MEIQEQVRTLAQQHNALLAERSLPHGIVGEKMCDVTFDEILDVQLTLYEVMIRAALERG